MKSRRVAREIEPETLGMEEDDAYLIVGEDDEDDMEVFLEARSITDGDLIWDRRGYQKYGYASGHGFGKTQFYKNRRISFGNDSSTGCTYKPLWKILMSWIHDPRRS